MPRGILSAAGVRLQQLDIDRIEIDYDRLPVNSGGVHYSTRPLIRDSV